VEQHPPQTKEGKNGIQYCQVGAGQVHPLKVSQYVKRYDKTSKENNNVVTHVLAVYTIVNCMKLLNTNTQCNQIISLYQSLSQILTVLNSDK